MMAKKKAAKKKAAKKTSKPTFGTAGKVSG